MNIKRAGCLRCASLANRLQSWSIGAIFLIATPSVAHGMFTDVTISSGVDYIQGTGVFFIPGDPGGDFTGGAAARDFDLDGWTDLFVTRTNNTDILFRNKGIDGNGAHLGFADVSTAAFGPGPLINDSTNGAAWGDINNDGNPDLYVTGVNTSRNYLYINQGKDGSGIHQGFAEQAAKRNAAMNDSGTVFGMSISFGDFDLDGFLDVHTGEWTEPGLVPGNSLSHALLLRNQGTAKPGHFVDVTASAGVSMAHGKGGDRVVRVFSPRLTDLNQDGRPDLATVADFLQSKLFINQGNGTFQNATNAPLGSDTNGMGNTVGDFNGDGLLDWFVTSIAADIDDEVGIDIGNFLYQNNGDGTFTNASKTAGVVDGGWGWGTSFLDFDNDYHLDLVMTNGWQNTPPFDADAIRLWHNQGNGTFHEIAAASGLTDNRQGRGLLTFDFDNDGDLDIFVVNNQDHPVLYRNDTDNDNKWLKVRTTGTTSNRDGLGTFITVKPNLTDPSSWIVREVDGGSNFLAQNDIIVHFGLGEMAGTIDEIELIWPSGIAQTFLDLSPNSTLSAIEPLFVPGDLIGNGFVNDLDIDILAEAIRDSNAHHRFDLNQDTSVNDTDLDYLVAEILFAVFGDANLNQIIDIEDFSALAGNFGGDSGWAGGNFNPHLDSTVDILDFAILAGNYGASLPATGSSVIPEPSTFGLILLSCAVTLKRRNPTNTRGKMATKKQKIKKNFSP